MILITGDIHGEVHRVADAVSRFGLCGEDTIVLLGDVGMNYYGNKHGDRHRKKRLNKLGSWHTWGQLTSSAGSCDHITVTSKDTKVLQFETLIYNDQHYASDHSWLIADIQFK